MNLFDYIEQADAYNHGPHTPGHAALAAGRGGDAGCGDRNEGNVGAP